MSGDELAAALKLEQGYVLVGSYIPMEVGEILHGAFAGMFPASITTRVVRRASRGEFITQARKIEELQGIAPFPESEFGWLYFTEVEALD